MEMVRVVEEVTGKKVPYVTGRRREGDPPPLVAAAGKLRTKLGWQLHGPADHRGARVEVRAGGACFSLPMPLETAYPPLSSRARGLIHPMYIFMETLP